MCKTLAFPTLLSLHPLLELDGSMGNFRRYNKVIWLVFLHKDLFKKNLNEPRLLPRIPLGRLSCDFLFVVLSSQPKIIGLPPWAEKANWFRAQLASVGSIYYVVFLTHILAASPSDTEAESMVIFLPMLVSAFHSILSRKEPGKLVFYDTVQSLETAVI